MPDRRHNPPFDVRCHLVLAPAGGRPLGQRADRTGQVQALLPVPLPGRRGQHAAGDGGPGKNNRETTRLQLQNLARLLRSRYLLLRGICMRNSYRDTVQIAADCLRPLRARASYHFAYCHQICAYSCCLQAPLATVDPRLYLAPPLQHKGLGWYPEWAKVWEGWGLPAHV